MNNDSREKHFVKLAHPQIPEDALQQSLDVLRSGALVQGRYVQKLESAVADYLGAEYAVVVSSGTAALHLALLASDIGPGDEVIVPAFTFPATANAVMMTGATPVVVDVNLDDFNISIDAIEAVITRRTRAIMPVHEFGLPVSMQEIRQIAEENKLQIIEDAACALGAEYDGKRIGSGANLACFSFHPRKAITTGEGGVIVTSDGATANRLRSLRNHGIIPTRDGRMDIAEAGLNYRMTDFQAALALAQLETLEEQIGYRQAIAGAYGSVLKDLPSLQLPATFPERRHVYQTYHILLEEAIDQIKLINDLRRRGIETNFGAWALNLLTLYQATCGLTEASCPNAVRAFQSGLALPIGQHVSIEDAHRVGQVLSECLQVQSVEV